MSPLVQVTIVDVTRSDVDAFLADNSLKWDGDRPFHFDPMELLPRGEHDYLEVMAALSTATASIGEGSLPDYKMSVTFIDATDSKVTFLISTIHSSAEHVYDLRAGDLSDDEDEDEGEDELAAAHVYIAKLEEQLNKQDIEARADTHVQIVENVREKYNYLDCKPVGYIDEPNYFVVGYSNESELVGPQRFTTHEEARSSARNFARQAIGRTAVVYNLNPCDEFIVETKPIAHKRIGT